MNLGAYPRLQNTSAAFVSGVWGWRTWRERMARYCQPETKYDLPALPVYTSEDSVGKLELLLSTSSHSYYLFLTPYTIFSLIILFHLLFHTRAHNFSHAFPLSLSLLLILIPPFFYSLIHIRILLSFSLKYPNTPSHVHTHEHQAA